MKLWQKIAATEASEIAEVALVLPLVFTLLLAIVWFGIGFNVYSTVTYAAREGASAAVVGNSSSCATCGTAPTAAVLAAAAAARVQQVLQVSNIDPGRAQPYVPTPAPAGNSCGTMTLTAATMGGGKINVYNNAQLNSPSTSGVPACGTVVAFQYPFTFWYLPFTSLNKQQILFKADAQMQAEN